LASVGAPTSAGPGTSGKTGLKAGNFTDFRRIGLALMKNRRVIQNP
jgi:hypothetical protein